MCHNVEILPNVTCYYKMSVKSPVCKQRYSLFNIQQNNKNKGKSTQNIYFYQAKLGAIPTYQILFSSLHHEEFESAIILNSNCCYLKLIFVIAGHKYIVEAQYIFPFFVVSFLFTAGTSNFLQVRLCSSVGLPRDYVHRLFSRGCLFQIYYMEKWFLQNSIRWLFRSNRN